MPHAVPRGDGVSCSACQHASDTTYLFPPRRLRARLTVTAEASMRMTGISDDWLITIAISRFIILYLLTRAPRRAEMTLPSPALYNSPTWRFATATLTASNYDDAEITPIDRHFHRCDRPSQTSKVSADTLPPFTGLIESRATNHQNASVRCEMSAESIKGQDAFATSQRIGLPTGSHPDAPRRRVMRARPPHFALRDDAGRQADILITAPDGFVSFASAIRAGPRRRQSL